MKHHDKLIARLLDKPFAEAKRLRSESAYWGDTGYWVQSAARQMAMAITRTPWLAPAEPDLNAALMTWLTAVDEALYQAHQAFRREEDDPEGYGSATFHEVRRDLCALIENPSLLWAV